MFFQWKCMQHNSEKGLLCLLCTVNIFSGKAWMTSCLWIPADIIISRESHFHVFFFSLKIEKWDSLWPGKGKCSGEVGKGFAHSIAEVSLIGAEYVRHKGWTTETIALGRTLVPFIWLPIKYGKFSSHCCLCQQTTRKAIGLNSAMLCAKTMIFLASFPKIPLICDYYDLICIYIHVLLLENNMCEKVEENYTQRHISVLFKNFLTKSLPKIKITKSDLS